MNSSNMRVPTNEDILSALQYSGILSTMLSASNKPVWLT
jgi:hypothetical protein